jgi:hypothetical protein
MGRLWHKVPFFDHESIDITFAIALRICNEQFGDDAIPGVSSTNEYVGYPYYPERCWTHSIGIFYFDQEDDAVRFRLNL